MEVKLTNDQAVAKKEVVNFLRSKDINKIERTLIGYAGTGKTFLINDILKEFNHLRVAAATISHSAKNILKEHVGPHVDCYTIAQLLGLRQTYRYGKEVFVQQQGIDMTRLPIYNANILIIDECSMIDEEFHQMILNAIPPDGEMKILYSGDSAQLPPVNEDRSGKIEISPTFKIADVSELREIVRYGEIIGTVAKFYRELIEYLDKRGNPQLALQQIHSFYPNWNNGSESIVYTNNSRWFLEQAIHDFSEDTLGTRIITYRNETIDVNNKVIREYFYAEDIPYAVGEVLILNRPFKLAGRGMPNGTVFQISQVHENFTIIPNIEPLRGEKNEKVIIPSYHVWGNIVNLTTLEAGEPFEFNAMHPNGREYYDALMDEYKHRAKISGSYYNDISTLRGAFIDANRFYCVSAYKSQGQSIRNTYVMLSDIMDVHNLDVATKLRSLYVAVTRAKKKCIVLI